MSEDELDVPNSNDRLAPKDSRVGRYRRIAAGRCVDGDYLPGSSSGGLTSWLLAQLLDVGLVDGVIHVRQSNEDESGLLVYGIASTGEQVRQARKSQYYAVTLADVLAEVRHTDKKYAIVGVPCFIKAARLLCNEDAELAARLKYFVGLVCGHLKSQLFAESLAWQVGIRPENLGSVDFRVKNPQSISSDYNFAASSLDGTSTGSAPTQSLVGGNWGHGTFQPEACNFCDDIFAETADIVFGDAWLPQYKADWRGTNILINRNEVLGQILADGEASGAVFLEDLGLEDAVASQGGNFRHRRDGLAVRLADDIAAGLSVPRKRVEPDLNRVDAKRRALVRQRRRISARSVELFVYARSSGNLDNYLKPMRKEIRRYRGLEASRSTRIFRRLNRYFSRMRSVAKPSADNRRDC